MTHRLQLSTRTHTHHEDDHSDDSDEEIEEAKPATIFDAAFLGENVPTGFDTVRIPIDGKVKASLSWIQEAEVARQYVKQGLRLFWEMDLGLFDRLERPLSDRVQFQTLILSLMHFRDSLWKEFRDNTVGLSLYRGNLDFSIGYLWDEEQITNLQAWLQEVFESCEAFASEMGVGLPEKWTTVTPALLQCTQIGKNLLRLFCRDAGGEYLELLAAQLPDPLPLYAFFDAVSIFQPYLMAQLLTKERFPRIHIGVKETLCYSGQVLGGEVAWNGSTLALGRLSRELKSTEKRERARLAFCLPKLSVRRPQQHECLENALISLSQKGVPFRIIPEVLLSSEWDDLDELIVDAAHVDQQLKRKLDGFSAAGGTVRILYW